MKTNDRKTRNANLEGKRPLYFLIGLSASLLAVFAAFELNFETSPLPDFSDEHVYSEELDWTVPVTVMTKPEIPAAPKPMPKFNPNEFTVVPNTMDLPSLNSDWKATSTDQGLELIVDPDPVDPMDIFTFTQVENMPVFAGCEDALSNDERMACMNASLMRYISKNFEVTDQMMNFSTGEKLYVEFIIEKNGEVRNARIVRGEDELMGNEAIRVVKSLPTFTPAKMNGKPVRMSYILPINIKF
jgi:protein TonB